MATSTVRLAVGAVLLVVCSAIIVGFTLVDIPLVLGGAAALGLAAGALLVGTSEGGRPV